MIIIIIPCIADVNGNTALWDAISAKHNSIFWILYHCASLSDPYTAGDLLCTAAKRNDLAVMKELLKQGLNIDSKNRQGLTAIQVAMAENHTDMVKLLVMNGADVVHANTYKFSSETLNEMLQKRETGHRIMMPSASPTDHELFQRENGGEREFNSDGGFTGTNVARVSVYRGHPLERKDSSSAEAGRLMRLPNSLTELKAIAGHQFKPHLFLVHLLIHPN